MTLIRRLLLLVVGAALLSACSGSSSPGGSSPGSGDQPLSTTAAPVTASPPVLPGQPTSFTMDLKTSDGYKARLTFSVYPMVKGGDPALKTLFPSGTPCNADPQTDAVFAGTVLITNESLGFSLSASIGPGTLASAFAAGSMSMGVGSDCIDANQQQFEDFGPDNTSWMRSNIEFVIHDVYSPAAPNGSTDVVKANEPYLVVERTLNPLDQFWPTSTGPGVTEIAGAVGAVQLNFLPLMNRPVD